MIALLAEERKTPRTLSLHKGRHGAHVTYATGVAILNDANVFP
jgi:hypothetical protein